MAYTLTHPRTNLTVILTSEADREAYLGAGWQEKKEVKDSANRTKRGTKPASSRSK